MNTTIETILAHRSIRKFTGEPIPPEQLRAILASGIAASSSSLLQAVSIIQVTDRDKRKTLADLAGNQPYVASCAEFLVFIIDYQRHATMEPAINIAFTELTLIGAIDAGIMAQNCLLAAESMGLGGVYIGGLRNNAETVDQLLDLPPCTAVLFGLCLGHPAHSPEVKPRLPMEVLVHQNSYQPLDLAQVQAFDHTMANYYANRTNNRKQSSWSGQISKKLRGESRPHMLPYLRSKGLAEK